VSTGLEGSERVEVSSGLTGDERVVVRGQEGLYAGARVSEVSDAAAAAPAAAPARPEPLGKPKGGEHANHH
jgi:hypothetical protein